MSLSDVEITMESSSEDSESDEMRLPALSSLSPDTIA